MKRAKSQPNAGAGNENIEFLLGQMNEYTDIEGAFFYLIDPDTYEIIFVNRQLATEVPNAVGRKCYSALFCKRKPCKYCRVKNVIGDKVGTSHTWEFFNEKSQRWLHCINRGVQWPDGKVFHLTVAIDITDYKKAQRSLAEINDRYNATLNALPDMLFELDYNGKHYDFWTPEEITTSINPEKYIGKQVIGSLPDDAAKKVMAAIKTVEKTQQKTTTDFKLKMPFGTKHYEAVISPKGKNDGDDGRVIALVRDITQRIQTENALRKSEEQYRTLFNESPESIVIIGLDGCIRDINKAGLVSGGHEYEDIVGHHFGELGMIPPEDLSKYSGMFTELIAGKEFEKVEVKIEIDAGERWMEVYPSRLMKDGKLDGFRIMTTNITERKLAERQVSRLSQATEQSPAMVVMTDIDGIVEYVNPKFEEVTGFSTSEMIGASVTGRAEVIGDTDKNLWETISSGTEWKGVFKVKKKHGGYYWESARISPIKDENGKTISFIKVAEDITQRLNEDREKEQFQKQILQMQKMEAIGQLAGGVAHDFNNIIAVIMGSASLVLSRLNEEDIGYSECFEIMRAAEHAKELTMNMLAFAREEKMAIRAAFANDVVRNVSVMIGRSAPKNILIKTKLKSDLPPIAIDSNQIQQALLNLCTNAVDSMPEGGSLIIETRKKTISERERARFGNVEPGKYCVITVKDNGEGIPRDERKKIFEPFFTTKEPGKGTGLGLSTTLGIVNNHHGHIALTSSMGKGTSVKMFIPFAEDKNDIFDEKMNFKIEPGHEHVLVVDDNSSLQKMIKKTLKDAGYKVTAAETGKEAISAFRKKSKNIDVALLDVSVPDMEVMEILKKLRKIKPRLKVVAFSGHRMSDLKKELSAKGVDSFVQKPFTAFELCGVLRRTLDK